MKYDKDRLIRTLRICIAIIIAQIIYVFFHHANYEWVLITIYVILFDQATVGGILYRGFLRLVATISGAIVGIVTLYLFKNNPIANAIVIVIASFLYSYKFIDKRQSYVGMLGLITIVMILINNPEGTNTAILRSSMIIIGIIISVVLTLIFFPQTAQGVTLKLVYKSINQFKSTIELLIEPNKNRLKLKKYFEQREAEFTSELSKLTKYIEEIKYEGKANKIKHYKQALLSIRRIYRTLTIFFQSKALSLNNKQAHEKLISLLSYYVDLTKQFESKTIPLQPLKNTHHIIITDIQDIALLNNLISDIYYETNNLVHAINQAQST